MKQINFLPAERLEGSPVRQFVPPLIIGIVAGVLAILLPWQLLRTQQADLTAQVDASEKLIGVIADEKANAIGAEMARQKADVTLRVQTVNAIVSSEVAYPELFSLVQQLLPSDISLTSLSIAITAGKPTIRFAAEAPSNASYANFLLLLRGDTHFDSIVTDGYNYNAAKGSVAFSITLAVKTPGVKK